MDKFLSACIFTAEWADYLEQHGHSVERLCRSPEVLVSRKGRAKGYRWLLRCAEGESLLLSPAQRKHLRRQVRVAERVNERAYVVIRFEGTATKVVVMPAGEAIRARRLSCDRGAIPWYH